MTQERQAHLNAQIVQALKAKPQRTALYDAMKRARDSRREALAAMPGADAFLATVRETKQRCLADQDALVARFTENARARGAEVFLATDGAAAIDYVLKLAAERGAKVVAKSKSLTTEEIEINEPLEAAPRGSPRRCPR